MANDSDGELFTLGFGVDIAQIKPARGAIHRLDIGDVALEEDRWFPVNDTVLLADQYASLYIRSVRSSGSPSIPKGSLVIAKSLPSKRGFDAQWVVVDGKVTRLPENTVLKQGDLDEVETTFGLLPTENIAGGSLGVFVSVIFSTLDLNSRVLIIADTNENGDLSSPLEISTVLNIATLLKHNLVVVPAGDSSGGIQAGIKILTPADPHQAVCLLLDALSGFEEYVLYKERVPSLPSKILLWSVWPLFVVTLVGVFLSYSNSEVGSKLFSYAGIAWALAFGFSRRTARALAK